MLNKEKEGLDSKLTSFQSASKDLDTLLGSQRPSPNIESKSNDLQNNSSSVSENGESTSSILFKPEIKFVKVADSPTVIKTNKDETVRKPSVKYAGMYRKTSKSSNVMGKQRNWNNLKSQQLGNNFLMKNKACYNCGDFDHLSYGCVRTQSRVPRVSTVNRKFPTVNRKFATGNSKVSTADLGNKGKVVKASAYWIWKPRQNSTDKGPNSNSGNSQNVIDDKGYWDNSCSWHMIGNISYLSDYEPYDGGYVSFGQGGCKITECIVLGRDFKLRDDTNVLLRSPRQHNMYFIYLNNIIPHKDLTCLVAKASTDESELWHRRLGHLNFKTMNMLVRHNLVKGLPSKCFDNDHTFFACLKGKQHKASYKTKDETSGILRNFITEIENLKDLEVKIIRCDNGGELRNKEINDLCSRKRIKREFSNARTPQQNRVAEKRNRTLIEAVRTMLADVKLPVTFWAEAVKTSCYVQNRVLTMNYHPVITENHSNTHAGFQDTEKAGEEGTQTYVLFPVLSDEFKEYYNKSSNGVNAASSSVFTAGQNSIDSTNDFSAASPSNAVMPNLEDLSHDEDDVGA
nr:hypothetical protein [Tanacetum cinerariifolium]